MDTNVWYKSKGVWGTLIAGACLVLQLTGVGNVTPEEQGKLADGLTNLAIIGGEVVGVVLAFVGRVKAKGPITLRK